MYKLYIYLSCVNNLKESPCVSWLIVYVASRCSVTVLFKRQGFSRLRKDAASYSDNYQEEDVFSRLRVFSLCLMNHLMLS